MEFLLHPNLISKAFVIDLPLCRVLMEDNAYYPWLFLVPRRAQLARIVQLDSGDKIQLMTELDWAQTILWDVFQPEQINVASIGNKTRQLHIHVIARKINDPAWPNTVWDHAACLPYDPVDKAKLLDALHAGFQMRL